MSKRKIWFLKHGILFVIGYCVYLAIEVTFRGYSFRLMGCVGGLALLWLSFITTYLNQKALPVRMLLGAAGITVLELLSGIFSLSVLNYRMWDYSGRWMSLCDGLICPLFTLFWFFLSGLGIVLIDCLNYYVWNGNRRPIYKIMQWEFRFPEKQRNGVRV